MKIRFAPLVLSLALSALAPGQQNPGVVDDEHVTAQALRAALLRDHQRVEELAQQRLAQEQAAHQIPRLSDNLAALAVSTRRPLQPRSSLRDTLRPYRPDQYSQAVLRLAEAVQPVERWKTARADRRYAQRVRVYNTVVGGITSVLSLQLFGLIQPPLEAIDYALIRRHFLSPEQRRELQAARLVAQGDASPQRDRAERAVESLMKRRLRLAALQAERNAERSLAQDRPLAAQWWFDRELLLEQRSRPFREEHLELLRNQQQLEDEQLATVQVVPGERRSATPDEWSGYVGLLRVFLLDPSPQATSLASLRYVVSYPASPLTDSARMARIASAQAAGEKRFARRELERVAASGPSIWASRSRAYLDRPDFSPAVAFEQAEREIARRKNAFILWGENPRQLTTHYTPEEARQLESSWIRAARSLFVTDMLARALAYPLLPGSFFPREELYEATQAVPPGFLETDEGRQWLLKTARACAKTKRHEQAAQLYARLAMPEKAARQQQKAAALLEKQARTAPGPADRLALYERLLSAYPQYRKRDRVRARAEEARRSLPIVARIQPIEWEAIQQSFPSMAGLVEIPEADIDSLEEPVIVMQDRIVWKPAGNAAESSARLGSRERNDLLRALATVRRSEQVDEALGEPPSRGRIPFAIEGSAGPGFDAAPALLPLQISPREMRLYQ